MSTRLHLRYRTAACIQPHRRSRAASAIAHIPRNIHQPDPPFNTPANNPLDAFSCWREYAAHPATAVNGRNCHHSLALPLPELARSQSWPHDREEESTPRSPAVAQGRAQGLQQRWHHKEEAVQEPQWYVKPAFSAYLGNDKKIELPTLTLSPGCITCKTKRLKCDETKPTCQQCAKRSVTCGGYKKDFKWRPFEEATFTGKPVVKTKKGWQTWGFLSSTSNFDSQCLRRQQVRPYP
jgi:hypothetical protein